MTLTCEPLNALNIKPIREREEVIHSLIGEINGARLAQEEPLRILDIGTGSGEFMTNLSVYLKGRVRNYQIWGVDSYSSFLESARDVWEMLQERTPENKILFKDVSKMGKEYEHTFDFTFINAPQRQNHIYIIEHGLRLTKSDGFVVVRYFSGEGEELAPLLEGWAKIRGYKVSKTYLYSFPEGACTLDRDAYIVRKADIDICDRDFLDRILGARLLTDRSA